ncbi:hypothetical protein L873DRAFT_1741186 [Choiromyces venosus 120613-1]|uniref:G-patch domain-containing protein n=1 Tax=Choiromyces venosus 120613-1 TaxID=1336337 RepID=A0A3N4JI92_9PEZI|nr:hypothetical protein L873DRAFT_1741186 [Choiromyces venosus 120613-1]
MSDPPPPPPARTGMSGLYANLLDPSNNTTTSTSISRAPIVFKQPSSTTAAALSSTSSSTPAEDPAPKKLNAAALRFQPTLKRPTTANVKGKGKNVRKPGVSGTTASAAGVMASTDTSTDTTGGGGVTRPIVKTTIEDWTGDADDDVNGFYATNRDQRRAGRKKRKKNRDTPPPPTNWDDVYDPSRPNSYEEYKEGDEKIREMEDWRDRVLPRRRSDSYDSEEEEEERERGRDRQGGGGNRFAPPAKYSFAPPPHLSGGSGDGGAGVPPPPPPPAAAIGPPVAVPDDTSGEDAYARRLRMSQLGSAGYSSTAPPSSEPPPPPPTDPTPQPTISRAPILYTTTPQTPPTTSDASEPPPTDQPPSPPSNPLLPGQKDFATRLMSKLGWRAGTGLGANNTGITQPLRAVHTKSKDQHSSSGGGGARGRIIDRNKPNTASTGKFGPASVVVVLRHMVDGLEGEEDEAVLIQEIGEECERSYGGVEHVLVVWGRGEDAASRVFVKFSGELAALRAVNALEGRLFNGNTIEARFFDKDNFEEREFD